MKSFAAPSQPERFETELYNAFAGILQKNVEGKDFVKLEWCHLITSLEFVPYIFQILAASLEANPSAPLPPNYQSLVGPLLSPQLWTMRGNIPALVRLLAAIVPRGAPEITRNNQLETLLGIFQQLVSTKTNEVQGFELLECIIADFPA